MSDLVTVTFTLICITQISVSSGLQYYVHYTFFDNDSFDTNIPVGKDITTNVPSVMYCSCTSINNSVSILFLIIKY